MKKTLALLFKLTLFVFISSMETRACGDFTIDKYQIKASKEEKVIRITDKELIVVGIKNSKSREQGKVVNVVPLRFELAGDSDVAQIVVKTVGVVSYLNVFAKYRCLNSPKYTFNLYLNSTAQIYLLKSKDETPNFSKEANFTLTSNMLK